MANYAVYRLFGPDHELLYIGISCHLIQRVEQHQAKPWGGRISYLSAEVYRDQAAALYREASLILTLHPPHNWVFAETHGRYSLYTDSCLATRSDSTIPLIPLSQVRSAWLDADLVFLICKQCGDEFGAQWRGAKYCRPCAAERNRASIRASQRRRRERLKALASAHA